MSRGLISICSLLMVVSGCSLERTEDELAKPSQGALCTGAKCDGTEGETEPLTAEERATKVLLARNIHHLKLFFTDQELAAQEALPGNEVDFERALKLALESFMYDGRSYESPLFIAHEDELEGGPCLAPLFGERIRCYLDQEDSILGLVHLDGAVREVELEGRTLRVYPPEEGESAAENWIFYLKLPQLSDHLRWAVVHRALVGSQGKTLVYNYGFN